MRIWDFHCHLAGAALPGTTPEEKARHLVAVADRLGIERLCLYMGTRLLAEPTAAQLREQNDEVLRAMEACPERLFGFVYLSPQHVETSLEELERCVAKGPMVGVKLWIAGRCNAPELDPLIQRATELQAVVVQHTWFKAGSTNQPGESTPHDFVELAQRHPQATLVCGHAGGDWELGLQAIRPLPNVYTELAGSDPVAGFTEMAVRELGAERVLYGSDAPGRSFSSQLAKVQGAALSQEDKALILGGNLRRLLQPIFDAKGIRA